MKGLKKLALASAIAAVAVGAQAELKALDDSTMSEMTGQKGLRIDLETKWSIGEFAYVDAGAIVLKDISMGGNTDVAGGGSMLDNVRLTIDVAGSGADLGPLGTPDNVLDYGMSEVRSLAGLMYAGFGNADAGIAAAAVGVDALNKNNFIDSKKTYGDGDLKIHFGFTDAWEKGGGYQAYVDGVGDDGAGGTTDMAGLSYQAARDIAARAVDFNFKIGQIALADSSYGDVNGSRLGTEVIQKTDQATGEDNDAGGASTTTLISDLSMKGYLGPMDILIENKGNGFDGTGAQGAGTGNANSKIQWDSFFKVTDLDLYIDIAGVQLTDIKIHNDRGDTTSLNQIAAYDPQTGTPILDASGNPVMANTSAFGFAHSKREIYAVKDAVLDAKRKLLGLNEYVDGIAINTQFKGDIDIGALSFGDTGDSIGSIYITDMTSTTNWTISAN
tara:strand:- start:11189 stop:12520 length:1332 start_codon:yes stop_codon:yes gene_type:complete